MEKEFVPYDLAVKLKDLGFNEECLAMYFRTSQNLKFGKIGHKPEFWGTNDKSTGVMSPLWQQAFDWFEKEYKLFASFDKVDNTRAYYFDFSIVKSNEREYCDELFIDSAKRDLDYGKYNTYEEARLKCLEKLIEIVENGKHK